jgi:hypothetical protein
MRPTAALLEEDEPFRGWTSHDYRIQEALNIMEREVCKQCGNPSWLCHSADNRIEFELRVGACYGTAEVQDAEKNPNAPKLESGEYYYAVPVGLENDDGTRDPLPSRLEAMQKLV